MNELLAGLKWLSEGGRDAAKQLQAHLLGLEEEDFDDIGIDEAVAWLEDIAAGKNIT